MGKSILTINGGSSSIRFALYSRDGSFKRLLFGKVDRISLPGTILVCEDEMGKEVSLETPTADFSSAIETLKAFLAEHIDFDSVTAIGHRIVHGMGRAEHVVVTNEVIAELKEISHIDPEHLPFEIKIIEMFAVWQPALQQVACFDTVFHYDMPRVAQMTSFPRRFEAVGMRRYGFHGLSCDFVMEELRRLDPEKALGRIIIAHLGNGASVTAVKNGKSFDTSMGFSPTSGVPMSTRSGDTDPTALLHVMKVEGLSIDAMSRLVNHESGLLGISETSSNMYDLLESEEKDGRAHDAVDLFCYEVKKRIGAYSAVLGGLDVLIFTGGMGENAPRIRRRVCDELEFLGVILDEARNKGGEKIISHMDASACVRVMHTDEGAVIARITNKFTNK